MQEYVEDNVRQDALLSGTLQAQLRKLDAISDAVAADTLAAQTPRHQVGDIVDDGGGLRWAPWSSTRPPASHLPSDTLSEYTRLQVRCYIAFQQAHKQGALDSQLCRLEEEAEGVLCEISKLRSRAKEQVAAAQQLGRTRAMRLRCHTNRWYNQRNTSSLLRLPTELLHVIEALSNSSDLRSTCLALRLACGSPGARIRLSGDNASCPALLAPGIRCWPWPATVLQLSAEFPLPNSAFMAACETFGNLQSLTIPTGSYAFNALPPTLTSLETIHSPNHPDKTPLDLGNITHLTVLQSLSVVYQAALPMDFTPLQRLVTLTRLFLRQDDTGLVYGAVEDLTEDPPVGSLLSTLSQLPALARFGLDAALDWTAAGGGDAPVVGESLCALTSLQLFCRHDMTLEGSGPPLAVVDMFRRMPVLARLELHRAHMLLPHDTPAALLEPLLQVWQDRKLEHLGLLYLAPRCFNARSVGRISSTLTTFTCNSASVLGGRFRGRTIRYRRDYRLYHRYISQMLPTPTPLHTVRLEGSITLESAQGMITLLAENAPQLSYLTLVSTLEQEPQTIQLSVLTNLRVLSLSGRALVSAFALSLASTPASAAMPALKELHLPDAHLTFNPASLSALTQLTHLELGAHFCYVPGAAGGIEYKSCLPAIRQLHSLSKLVLGASSKPVMEWEVMQMVPPPVSLQALDLNNPMAESKAVFLRVLGDYIKHIRFINLKLSNYQG